jgi:hypothetical protein
MIDKNPSLVDSSVLRNDGTGDSTKLAAAGAAIVPTASPSGEPSAAYQSGLDALTKETASFKAALNAAQPDAGRGLDVRQLVFSPASPDVPLDKSLDGILSASSAELSKSCQADALRIQTALTYNRSLTPSTTKTASEIDADIKDMQLQANLLISRIQRFVSSVTGQLAVDEHQFSRDIADYNSGSIENKDTDKTKIEDSIVSIRADLKTLFANIGTGSTMRCLALNVKDG